MVDDPRVWFVSGVADPDWLVGVEKLLAEAWDAVPHLPAQDRMLFDLAVQEIAANMVEHGVQASCDLELSISRRSLTVRMQDEGPADGVDISGAHWPDDDAEQGRGLMIARTALDVFEHSRHQGRNHWLLVRRLRPG